MEEVFTWTDLPWWACVLIGWLTMGFLVILIGSIARIAISLKVSKDRAKARKKENLMDDDHSPD